MRFFKDEEMQNYHDTVVNVESMKAYYRDRHDAMREQLAEDELIRRRLRFDACKATGATVTENLGTRVNNCTLETRGRNYEE